MDYAAQTAIFVIAQFPKLVAGFLITVGISAAAIPLALALGLVLLVPRMARNRAARGAAVGYIDLMRNTPLLVQIYLIYFGLPVLGFFPSEFTCGVAGIALQHAAFFVETYRAGIESVGERQRDAARAIGMGRFKAFRVVILPQALIRILGPLGNQLIVLIKDTSLVSAIGVAELTLTGKVIIERSAASVEIFVAVALFYLVLTTLVGAALRLVEYRVADRIQA
jgi:polar amino acid transport system permease protein